MRRKRTAEVEVVRQCRDCGKVLPIDRFCPIRTNTMGGYRRPNCRKCYRDHVVVWEKTISADMVRAQKRVWSRTPKAKEIRRKYNETTRGLEVNRASVRKRVENGKYERWANSSKGRSVLRAAQARRRALKINAPGEGFTACEWEDCKQAHKQKCYYCGKNGMKLTMDHVIPLSRGGHHDKTNIVAACSRCNKVKGAKIYELF